MDNSRPDSRTGLRIVAFHAMAFAYRFVADWAAQRGHELILVVASPGRGDGTALADRYGNTVAELISTAPPSQDFLVTRRMKSVAAPVIRALAPDLILSATFPHRIPPEVVAIPRLGAVNLHPSPLPRGRGSNPLRLIYEGEQEVAGALHRITPEWDAGPILSVQKRSLPEHLTEEALGLALMEALGAALDEGVARAVAGDPGEPQDEAAASFTAAFTDDERRLNCHEPGRTLQRRTVVLNLLADARAQGEIAGQWHAVRSVRPLPGPAPGAPGDLVERRGDRLVVRAGDGLVEVEVVPEASPAA